MVEKTTVSSVYGVDEKTLDALQQILDTLTGAIRKRWQRKDEGGR